MLRWAPADTWVRRSLSAIYASSGISSRHSVLEDFKLEKEGSFVNQNAIPDTGTRMKKYEQEARNLIQTLFQKAENHSFNFEKISHIVWVSCTGQTAPGMETWLLRQNGFSKKVQATAFNFLGCHGFFHALRYAKTIVSENREHQVMVVCLELCTLHFQPKWDADHLLANALFGDGAAMVLVNARPEKSSLKIKSQSQSYFHHAADDMTWNIGNHGFEMRLSQELPHQVELALGQSIAWQLEGTQLDFQDLSHFIIHPGGKRILDKVEEVLSLPHQKLAHSRKALQTVGNVSSASILFALQQFLNSEQKPNPGLGIMLGVGPGLSLETALFEF
jgi:predicted naringenin-chalcone synthase